MKTLENMARDMFTKFSIKETGKPSNWAYLSDERKLEWMKDVFKVADYYMLELKAELKPVPNNMKSNTVYESGFIDGTRAERVTLHQSIDRIHNTLVNELIDFEQKLIKSKRRSSP
jgi:hypothetical protein